MSQILRNTFAQLKKRSPNYSDVILGMYFISLSLASSVCNAIADALKPSNIYYFEPSATEINEIVRSPEKKEKMTCGDLGIDETCVVIKSNVDYEIKFLYASMECEKCLLEELETVPPFDSKKAILKFASLGSVWEVVNHKNITICSQQKKYLGENSNYHLYVNETGCSLVCDVEPEVTYYRYAIYFRLPGCEFAITQSTEKQEYIYLFLQNVLLLFAFGVYLLLAIMWVLGKYLKRKEVLNHVFHRNSLDVSTDLAAAYSSSNSGEEIKKNAAAKRLKSLDTVRGLAIVIMIFVNYGGGKYWFFHHSRWNGLTLADLVFPWFMWMMGMSMALSMRSLLRKAVPKLKIFYKIIKRSVILFALGIMLNTYCLNVNLQELRIPGVLQRFGITYFVVASIHLLYASANDDQTSLLSPFRDITPYSVEWLIMSTFLATHILLMFFVHSPNCPAGYFGPGGTHDGGAYSLCTGGAAGFVDRVILGKKHLYQHASIKAIYHNILPHDPEGILGFLTSFFLVFMGLQAGKILLTFKEWKSRLTRWMIWALLMGTIAAVLCLCSKNDGFIPVNKNLWSVSFVMATGSLAFTLMSICYFVIDVKKWWDGAPFFYAGMNSILLYVGHEITHTMFPWSWEVKPTHGNELFQDLWGTTLWVLIAIWMHHKKFFLTI